jgi:glycosyltransferase involved in cell wall biosynthesis
MKLSVIIPCFNGASTIAVQLEALAKQQWSEPWEVIVSDNGSTDESVAIVEQYKEKLPNLRIVNSSGRQGVAHALNCGVQAAAADAFALCDADDEVAPSWLAAMGNALSKYDLVACRCEFEKLNEPWTLKYRAPFQSDGLQEYKYPPFLPHASACSLGFRRSLHEAIGGFDESIPALPDTDFCWRAQLAGTQLHFVPDAVLHYRFRDTLRSIYRQGHSYGESNVLLYKKYRPLGMPELSWKAGVSAWMRLLKRFPAVLSEENRALWVRAFGWRMGRLRGCIKYRVLAL